MPKIEQIKISEDAYLDIESMFSYISANNKTAAEKLRKKIYDRIRGLKDFPFKYPVIRSEDIPGVDRDYRYMVVNPYIVFYKVVGPIIVVARVTGVEHIGFSGRIFVHTASNPLPIRQVLAAGFSLSEQKSAPLKLHAPVRRAIFERFSLRLKQPC